jgi:hypothetical protein
MISTSFVHHQKTNPKHVSVPSPFLRHINMDALALIMFVAFALLSSSHGKDAGNGGPAPVGIAKGEVIIDKSHDDVSKIVSEPAGQTMSAPLTLWQFMSMIVNAFEGAFNDPSLIEYGNQQGTDISELLTTPCPNTSSQPLTTSKPPSSHSTRSSSSY